MANRNDLPVQLLERRVFKRFPAARLSLDRPRNPSGIWFLDIALEGRTVRVQWQEGKGFGITCSAGQVYGEGPDEIYPTEEAAFGRILSLLLSKIFTSSPEPIGLKELRKETGFSQAELAELLDKQQGEISKIERRKDLFLSTLVDYVRAVGGELQLTVRMSDGSMRRLQVEDTFESPSATAVTGR